MVLLGLIGGEPECLWQGCWDARNLAGLQFVESPNHPVPEGNAVSRDEGLGQVSVEVEILGVPAGVEVFPDMAQI